MKIQNNDIYMDKKKNLIRHSICPISSFDNISLVKNKPLIICDIDNTLLYHKIPKKNNDNICFFFRKFIDCFSHPIVREILPIDIGGFNRLEERVKKINGKIIFLSERDKEREKIIEYDFQQIGLDSKKYEIYYITKKYSKGQYAHNHLRTFVFTEVIFIDDLYENHLSMFEYLPKAKLFLFCNNFI